MTTGWKACPTFCVRAQRFARTLRGMNPRIRSKAIADWRGLPEMPFPQENWQPVAGVLDKVIAQLGLGKRVREEEILRAWEDIVGPFIAQHSCPQRLVDGVLHIRVLQPAMLYELDRTLRADILAKLKGRFGRTVRDVKFLNGKTTRSDPHLASRTEHTHRRDCGGAEQAAARARVAHAGTGPWLRRAA
jgi:hypothetical protein